MVPNNSPLPILYYDDSSQSRKAKQFLDESHVEHIAIQVTVNETKSMYHRIPAILGITGSIFDDIETIKWYANYWWKKEKQYSNLTSRRA